MEILFNRLEKLANGLMVLDPKQWKFDISRTVETEDDKVIGGCAWGYAPEVFPDELTRNKWDQVPQLKVNSSMSSWSDCATFFGIDSDQRNELFEDCVCGPKRKTAKQMANRILKFCKKHQK